MKGMEGTRRPDQKNGRTKRMEGTKRDDRIGKCCDGLNIYTYINRCMHASIHTYILPRGGEG